MRCTNNDAEAIVIFTYPTKCGTYRTFPAFAIFVRLTLTLRVNVNRKACSAFRSAPRARGSGQAHTWGHTPAGEGLTIIAVADTSEPSRQ